MRRKKTHAGDCSAKASGRYAVAAVSASSRSSPYTAATTGAAASSTRAKPAESSSSSVKACWNSVSWSAASLGDEGPSMPTRLSDTIVIVVTVTTP
jgi:hypothetical protein